MKTYSTRQLQLNISKALEELPFCITKFGKIIAVVSEPEIELGLDSKTGQLNEVSIMTKNKPQVKGNKAFQDFMAKNTMLKSDEVVNKATGRQCELPICRRDAVDQGVWVEYDMDFGERVTTLWLCQEHLEKGRKNAAHV